MDRNNNCPAATTAYPLYNKAYTAEFWGLAGGVVGANLDFERK